MGILKRAGDLVYTFRFLRLLTTKFEDTDAYKLGIIDGNGQRIKSKKIESSSDKDAYTPFHRLVFNIKKIMAKVPGGGSSIASYAAALFLIKEKYNLSDNKVEQALNEANIEVLDLLAEQSEWFMLENEQLAPGVYKVKNSKVINETCEEVVMPNDKIRVMDDSYPVGHVFGIRIYEAIHMNTKQKIYISSGEISR